ncbi:hypothetical protein JD292_02535 [Leucobacter sp. CSA2]|uniref:Uncharacterized protein n=1 Tax=Leucobacter edaphi TaxID=2796472 RepID=A0A934QA47_9MICO|nr:hypothetical protein [Leucobacter edaphi]MBK0420959.1 hypothetical protein [Leucobacter edaphi]
MTSTPAEHLRSRAAWVILRVLLALETIAGGVLLWDVVVGFIRAADEPLTQRLSLLLAVAIWWLWIAITLFGALRGRASWVRGSALTIHVLLFAAATGVLQGILGPMVGLGVALLAAALIGFVAAILARPNLEQGSVASGETANG